MTTGLGTVSGVGSASGMDLANLGLATGSSRSPGIVPFPGNGLGPPAEDPGTGFVPAEENVKKRQSAST